MKSETVCQFCGVSFAIARLRREDEPFGAAWSKHGHGFVDFYKREIRCDRGGCRFIQRIGTSGTEDFDDVGVEHLAGRGCTSDRGYNGYRISVEEMNGSRAIQCLMKKVGAIALTGEPWEPEPDDQDFELTSQYFLTGVGDGSLFDYDTVIQHLSPVRHNTVRFYPINAFRMPGHGSNDQSGIPFHPTCFEIFKGISKQRLDQVDVHGLWSWRKIEPTLNQFLLRFPHDSAVKNARGERWIHKPGCEYLVANPIAVPGLSNLLDSCQKDPVSHHVNVKLAVSFVTNRGESCSDDYFTNIDIHRCFLSPCNPPPHSAVGDHFTTLPNELRHFILDQLSTKDIANLRLVSPAFRQLPPVLFRKLIFEDMPYLFEAEDLPIRTTDWFRLYATVTACGQDLKGLRNRKRIWKDVTEVVRRIEHYRKVGKIVD